MNVSPEDATWNCLNFQANVTAETVLTIILNLTPNISRLTLPI